MPVYAVSPEIAGLFAAEGSIVVSFDLEMACEHGIHVAIMRRYLLHVIDQSPKGEAYNLNVKDMAKVNKLSPAQIYRAISFLIHNKVLSRVKSQLKSCSRALSLARYNPQMA